MLSKEKTQSILIEFVTFPKWNLLDKFHSLFNIFSKYLQDDISKNRINQYDDIWQSAKLIQNNYNPDCAWEQVKQRLNNSENNTESKFIGKKKFLIISTVSAAVITLLLILTFSYIKSDISKRDITFSEYHVPYGSRSKVTLPDGTQVWLNAGSTLKYPPDYNIKNRQVLLEGEAFFEVTKNASKAFIVKTESAAVKVLGTAFNLKAYPEENVVETTVTRGTVEVCNKLSPDSYPKKIILKAHEKVCLRKTAELENHIKNNVYLSDNSNKEAVLNSDVIISRHINPNVSSSWKENEWIIESESLSEFAVKMERRFNVTIHFIDKPVQNLIFSGKLKDESLNQMLEAISKTAPISYKIKNTDVYLSKRKLK